MAWQKVKLGELCKMNSGGTPRRSNPQFYNGNIPWAKISDIENANGTINETEEKITEAGLRNINNRIFPSGTLFLAMYGSVGKCAISSVEMSTNQAILGIQVNTPPRIDINFLKYWLKLIQRDLKNRAVGGTLQNISLGIVKELEIPFPDLPTQQRIVQILEEADALRQADAALLEKYEELLQSVFFDLFGNPETNEKKWVTGTIRDLITTVTYGTSKPAEENGLHPYLRMNNITYSGDWDFSSLKRINLTENEKAKYLLKKGDLVFNRTNSKELVGKTAVYHLDEEMAIAGYLIRVRTNEKANPEYISAFLNSIHGKLVLKNMCKSIIGMANINAQELQNIRIHIPPVKLQNHFAEIVAGINEQKQLVKAQQQQSEALFQSLLQRAFNGQL